MRTRWLAVVIGFAVLLSTAAFGSVVPTPAYPGAAASLAYKISVDGQPVFVHRFPTFNQFQWMDYGSITMTGKVHVTITSLVNDRNVITCSIRPLAYGISTYSSTSISSTCHKPDSILPQTMTRATPPAGTVPAQ